MALTTQLNLQGLLGGASGKGIAAGTNYRGISIIRRMNIVLHNHLVSVNADLPSIIAGRLEFNHAIN